MAIKRIKGKDIRGLQVLYEHFAGEMLSLAFRMINDKKIAEDVVQDAFYQVYEKIHQLKNPSQFKFWLKRIVANKSMDQVREQINFEPIEGLEIPVEIEQVGYSHLSFTEIAAAIQQLPPGSRQVLTLYLLDDFKHKEIAELLAIALRTSNSQYRSALKLLRAHLIAFCNE